MKIKKGAIRKFISILSSFLILINSFTPYLLIAPALTPVKAQTETPTPTPEPTIVPTENLTPTLAPTVTETATPTPTVDVTPTIEVTPVETVAPTVEPTLTPVEATSVPSPPEATPTPASDLQTQVPSPTATPTPEVLALESKIGTVETQVVDTFSCRSDSLNGCLATDKPDYAPTEAAVITGHEFMPSTIYTIIVSSNDQPAVTFSKEITTDSTGSFTYSYQLDGTYRPNYLVELKDSSGQIVASVTFTDSSDLKICHRTSSLSNPFSTEHPDIENNGSLSGGHLDHTGPTYPNNNWGDIIPPYNDGDFHYAGMNWDAFGQAVLDNNCSLPADLKATKTNNLGGSKCNSEYLFHMDY